MRYLSVCSGIEAATIAWEPLGWRAVGFAEIDKFASAVLAERFGSNLPGEPLSRNGVPNFGDFTSIDVTALGPIDLLVGGTPCQAFSFAGRRLSLADARGNLTLAYAVLAHELARSNGLRNALWENVPGVLSTEDNAFGCFLGALVGADDAVPLPNGIERWPDAGMVSGPRARAAWRVLDAQYFGLAQRRERVFVVVDFGNGADPAAVLFEPQGMSGNSPPRREAGERVAGTVAARTQGGGGLGTDFECDGGLIAADLRNGTLDRVGHTLQGGGAGEDRGLSVNCVPHIVTSHDVSQSLLAKGNSSHRADAESYVAFRTSGNCGAWETGDRTDALTTSTDPNSHIIAHTLRGEGFDASEDGTGRGIPLVPVAFDTTQITSKTNRCNPQPGDPCHPLAATSHPPTIAFTAKDYGGDAQEDLSPTLRVGGFTESHANAGVMPAIAYPIDMRQASRGEKFTNNRKEGSSGGAPGTGVGEDGDPSPTVAASHVPAVVHFQGRGSNLDIGKDVAATLGTNADRASGGAPCVAYDMRGREGGAQFEGPHDTANMRAASGGSSRSYVQQGWAVRRLTPVECARLQGFPDRHSRIPWRGKAEDECPDGPQYKTFGNSMAVKCMRWLGERFEMAFKQVCTPAN